MNRKQYEEFRFLVENDTAIRVWRSQLIDLARIEVSRKILIGHDGSITHLKSDREEKLHADIQEQIQSIASSVAKKHEKLSIEI